MTALVAFFAKDGATPLSGKTFGDIFAGATGTAEKFAVRNVGDRLLGTAVQLAIETVLGNDGVSRVRIALDAATLSPPWNVAASVGGAADGGTWPATGTYGVVLTTLKAGQETIISDETTFVIDDVTKRVTYTWAEVTGGDGYRIYVTATPGDYSANVFRHEITGSGTTSWIDDGTDPGPGAPPDVNATGGVGPDYGTPPGGLDSATAALALGQTPGTLQMGEMDFFWVNRVVPSNSVSDGNPRQAKLRIRET